MNKLIIHIGPGKCGSSSIQTFFKENQDSCIEKFKFILIDPYEINKMNQENPPEESIHYFKKMIENGFKNHDVVIISQEFFIQCSLAVKNISGLFLNRKTKTIIIGYSRKQSGFISSAYAQWYFRSVERVNEINETVIGLGLNPVYFRGSEKMLIASIGNDFYTARQLSGKLILDWNNTYKIIEDNVLQNNIIIRCGVLPNKKSEKNLIEDFVEKAEITLKEGYYDKTILIENERFNEHLIEATYIAAELGLNIPSPHSTNEYLLKISKNMKSPLPQNNEFLDQLKQYIDNYFNKSNLEFCEKYGIDDSHFRETNHISKDEIITTIKNEQIKRAETDNIIELYKEIIGSITEASFLFQKEEREISPINAVEEKSMIGKLVTKLKRRW